VPENSSDRPPIIDRLIKYVSPKWAAHRAYYRGAIDALPQIGATYRGGIPTRLDTQWSPTLGFQGANAPLNRWRLTQLRDRARDLERNNTIACGMLDRATENVIGHGFRLQAQTDDGKFNKQVEALWSDWTERADIRGRRSWVQLQRLIYRSRLRDGDVGCAFVQRGQDVRLQPISGDLIDTQYGGYDAATNTYDGIQFDKDGRAQAYNVISLAPLTGQRTATVVSANDFVFLSRDKNLDQVRGEPCFAQVMPLFDQIDGYIEAVVIAARVAACQALLIKSGNSGKEIGKLGTAQNSQGQYQPIAGMEPGMVRYLRPGEEVVAVNPTQPQQQFPDFVAMLLRFAGVSLGMPLELVLLDFSRTNYSSARAALLQAYRVFRSEQTYFTDHFLRRVYRWRVSKWVKDGVLVPPAAIQSNYWKHSWIAPGWAWVDPTKEIEAALMEVDGGLNTLTNIAAQHGHDFYELVQARKRELDTLAAAGIPTARSARTRDPATVAGAPSVVPQRLHDYSEDDGDAPNSDTE
jgi:lambda family phage portal protein